MKNSNIHLYAKAREELLPQIEAYEADGYRPFGKIKAQKTMISPSVRYMVTMVKWGVE